MSHTYVPPDNHYAYLHAPPTLRDHRGHSQGSTAYVHTRVELFYRRFLEEVNAEYNNDEDLFDAHLKAIIGVLYVEGLVNYKLYEFTAAKFARGDLVESYWHQTNKPAYRTKLTRLRIRRRETAVAQGLQEEVLEDG